MTYEERERSYERYKQWQRNKARYEDEGNAYAFFAYVGLFFVLAHWQSIRFLLIAAAIIISLVLVFRFIYKRYQIQQRVSDLEQMTKEAVSDLEQVAKEVGAKDIKVDSESGRISFTIPSKTVDDVVSRCERVIKNDALKLSIDRTKIEHSQDELVEESDKKEDKMENRNLKSTEQGYINRNNQRNNGRSNERGSDNNQWFYYMECLKCGKQYRANGSDIFQRKCPACQGGRP